MRRILIASLLLSPVLFVAPAVASQPGTDAVAATHALRVSTGVTAPEIIRSTRIEISDNPIVRSLPNDEKVVLSLNVDTHGRPNDIQVMKSVNADLDASVVSAVRQFKFAPATLDNQAISMDINLIVDVQK